MSLRNLVGDADCGPVNPVKGFVRTFSQGQYRNQHDRFQKLSDGAPDPYRGQNNGQMIVPSGRGPVDLDFASEYETYLGADGQVRSLGPEMIENEFTAFLETGHVKPIGANLSPRERQRAIGIARDLAFNIYRGETPHFIEETLKNFLSATMLIQQNGKTLSNRQQQIGLWTTIQQNLMPTRRFMPITCGWGWLQNGVETSQGTARHSLGREHIPTMEAYDDYYAEAMDPNRGWVDEFQRNYAQNAGEMKLA